MSAGYERDQSLCRNVRLQEREGFKLLSFGRLIKGLCQCHRWGGTEKEFTLPTSFEAGRRDVCPLEHSYGKSGRTIVERTPLGTRNSTDKFLKGRASKQIPETTSAFMPYMVSLNQPLSGRPFPVRPVPIFHLGRFSIPSPRIPVTP
jgi:hypothetical protein